MKKVPCVQFGGLLNVLALSRTLPLGAGVHVLKRNRRCIFHLVSNRLCSVRELVRVIRIKSRKCR